MTVRWRAPITRHASVRLNTGGGHDGGTVADYLRAVAAPVRPCLTGWAHAHTQITMASHGHSLRDLCRAKAYPRPRFPAALRAAAVTVAPSSLVPTSSTSSHGGRLSSATVAAARGTAVPTAGGCIAVEAAEDDGDGDAAAKAPAAAAGCGHRSRNQLPSLGTSTWRSSVTAPAEEARDGAAPPPPLSSPPPPEGTASVKCLAVLATT